MIADYFKLGFKNIKNRKVRSWLTMLGIFIGIAAVVALISLGQGLQEGIEEQFENLGTNTITVEAGAVALGAPGTSAGTAKLTDRDIDLIKKVRGVNIVIGYILKLEKADYKGEVSYEFIMGAPIENQDILRDAQGQDIIDGRDLKTGDKYKAVVGYEWGTGKMFDKPVEVGNKIRLGKDGQEFRVVGILSKVGNRYDDGTIYIPIESAKEILGTGDEINYILVKTKENEDVSKVAEEIEKTLRKDRGQEEGEEDFRVRTSEQILNSFTDIFGIVQAVFIGIAAISLVVGGIGIMNTMYTAVLERTKEIGIMKAVGAKNSHILTLFLIESGILGLVGGAIGVLIGILLSVGAAAIASQALGSAFLRAYFPWYLIIGALAFSFIIGSLSGILPAIQASKMKPVDALRYE